MAEFRRVPMRRLIARLGLSEYKNTGPLIDHRFAPRSVILPLKQHAGAAALPQVRTSDQVRQGDLLAAPEHGKLGARIHASIDGVVTLAGDSIAIEAR